MGFLYQLSERLLRVLVQHMMVVLSRWVSLCFLQGRSCSGGLFWLLFWAVAKEPRKIIMAPARRDSQPIRVIQE